jgi:hypothetical protein
MVTATIFAAIAEIEPAEVFFHEHGENSPLTAQNTPVWLEHFIKLGLFERGTEGGLSATLLGHRTYRFGHNRLVRVLASPPRSPSRTEISRFSRTAPNVRGCLARFCPCNGVFEPSQPLRPLCLCPKNSVSRQRRLRFDETRFECVIIEQGGRAPWRHDLLELALRPPQPSTWPFPRDVTASRVFATGSRKDLQDNRKLLNTNRQVSEQNPRGALHRRLGSRLQVDLNAHARIARRRKFAAGSAAGIGAKYPARENTHGAGTNRRRS